MANIYFLRDGEVTRESRPAMEIALSLILEKFGTNLKFLGKSDVSLSQGPPSQYPQWIVIRVQEGEAEGLPNLGPGFYVLDAVPFDKFQATFG